MEVQNRKERRQEQRVQQQIQNFHGKIHSYSKSIPDTGLPQKRPKNDFHSYAKMCQEAPVCMEASQPPDSAHTPHARDTHAFFTQVDDVLLSNRRTRYSDDQKRTLEEMVESAAFGERNSTALWVEIAKKWNQMYNAKRNAMSLRRTYERIVKEKQDRLAEGAKEAGEEETTVEQPSTSVEGAAVTPEGAVVTPEGAAVLSPVSRIFPQLIHGEDIETSIICDQEIPVIGSVYQSDVILSDTVKDRSEGSKNKQKIDLIQPRESPRIKAREKQEALKRKSNTVSNHDHGLYALRHEEQAEDPQPGISVSESHKLLQAVLSLSSSHIAQVALSIPSLKSAIQQKLASEQGSSSQDSRSAQFVGLWQHDYC